MTCVVEPGFNVSVEAEVRNTGCGRGASGWFGERTGFLVGGCHLDWTETRNRE